MPPNEVKPQGPRRQRELEAETIKPEHNIGEMLASPRATGKMQIDKYLNFKNGTREIKWIYKMV